MFHCHPCIFPCVFLNLWSQEEVRKSLILIKNHKIINKNIEVVKLEILKVKTWFWNKDLSSLDSIN